MDTIIEPNKNFDFTKLTLSYPMSIQGGAYFTKLLCNNKPLYIQTSQSLSRQGIVKSGKKYYIDLMFDNNSSELIQWFENLEEKCHSLIFEKSEEWFQGTLEENDVDSAFNSIIRVFKSGKYYLVRAYIKNNNLTNTPNIKIYDENEVTLSHDDITNESKLISILEIQGIKFTSRNFQMEIELKQLMVVLNNEPIFESCLIKSNKNKESIKEPVRISFQESTKNNNSSLKYLDNLDNLDDLNNLDEQKQHDLEDLNNLDNSKILIHSSTKNKDDQIINLDKFNITKEQKVEDKVEEKKIEERKVEEKKEETNIDFDLDLDIEDLEEETEDIKEFDLNINDSDISLEKMTLKKPNQVYFELYKEARNKAKQAKKSAIMAYLEAKKIKKTYMLENIDGSDSEFDEEIECVSESELENL